MNIFINCNNLAAFRKFVKTYSSENKKHHFIFGRQDIGLLNRKGLVFGSDEELIEILKLNDINDYEIIHATEVNTTLMHIGGLYKMKVLENIMEAYNGNIQ